VHAFRLDQRPSVPDIRSPSASSARRFTAIFQRSKGRIIIASFASNVPRIQQAIDHAARFGRKVAFLGRSMQNVVHFATELGHLVVPPDITFKIEQVDELPPDRWSS